MSDHSNLHPLLKVVQSPVTNVYFFVFVSTLFLLFASSEIYSALYSNSLSLLGDSTALSVEILTFVTIMLTDLIKSQSDCSELSYSLLIFLDVFLPLLYMTGLVVAIVYIVMEASIIIDKDGEGFLPVNTTYLYLFSLSNFGFHVLNSSAFRCKIPGSSSAAPRPPVAVPDEANQAFLADPEATNAASTSTTTAPPAATSDNDNINPASHSANGNNYGTHTTAYDSDAEGNPLVNGKAFIQQLNMTLLNLITVMGIDVVRGTVVLITAIIISTASVSSPYADAVAALLVVVTMLPMFIPVIWKYCCVNSN